MDCSLLQLSLEKLHRWTIQSLFLPSWIHIESSNVQTFFSLSNNQSHVEE